MPAVETPGRVGDGGRLPLGPGPRDCRQVANVGL